MHRIVYSNGIDCGDQDVVRWDSEYGQVENQANVFAANVLMPLDGYRRRIPAADKVDLKMLSDCAERYKVSLIAAILWWLEYTDCRAVLGVSRDDGYILWAYSSKAALTTGAFFRTFRSPIELPPDSLVAQKDMLVDSRAGALLPAGVWFCEEVKEMTIFADQYDFAVSLLLLSNEIRAAWHESEREPDTFDRFNRGTGR